MINVALGCVLGGAVATAAAIATDSMWLAVPAVAVFGFCNSVAGISIQTAIQLAADRSMQGRVLGLFGLIFRGSPAIGALAAGLASAQFGLRWPVFAGAVLVVAVCVATWLKRKLIVASLASGDAGREQQS